eukprot:IDg22697t1
MARCIIGQWCQASSTTAQSAHQWRVCAQHLVVVSHLFKPHIANSKRMAINNEAE